MAFSEELKEQSRLALKGSLSRLVNSTDMTVVALTSRFGQRLNAGHFHVVPYDTDDEVIRSMKDTYFPGDKALSNFTLYVTELENKQPELGAMVYLHAERMISESPQKIDADLVRTLSLVDQFPKNGYEQRYRTSMKRALEVQRNFLSSQNYPVVSFDPRTKNLEVLLKELLGEVRYTTDIGLADYQAAFKRNIPRVRKRLTKNQQEILQAMKDDTELFLLRRYYDLLPTRDGVIQAMGDRYAKLPMEERVWTAAETIFLTLLAAFKKPSRGTIH